MEESQLREALAEQDAVLGSRRTRRRRRIAVSAVVIVAVLLVPIGWFATRGKPDGDAPMAAAEACIPMPLGERMRQVLDLGASVVVAGGTLTGRTGPDGPYHHEMTLTAVRTLAGPALPDGTKVWVDTPQLPPLKGDTMARGNPGPLWGPGGALFGFVFPPAATNSPLGVTVIQSPVVGDQVIFGSSGGCWDVRSVGGTPFHGPLTEIPGSGTYVRAAEAGFTAVPLTTVEQLLPR
ncbi:hypothetical protein GCM10010399_65950 [Dactylosporangium fulvum]|uniref:Uncharacterized protein n=1 Tax=Dactylosporangium fulvum TaxID=53359 RepID=A0ABY5VXH6_9ACTN|nr:hypothetical protein [Dactylosporangium fulvum]UWP80486.1 hypothetical protein Dfulv_35745 [Dactylosporangium fulvum]